MTSSANASIRPLDVDDVDQLRRLEDLAFGSPPSDAHWAEAKALLEVDRSLAAYDGGAVAGHASAFTFEMAVPGGTVPVAGVTWVMVAPMHRRRGVLTGLMRRQLDDLRDREPVAALWASEPAIYGRFGYGLASRSLRLTVPRGHNALRPVDGSHPVRLRVEAVDDESLAACADVEAATWQCRPGQVRRSGPLLRYTAEDLPERRGGATPMRILLAEDTGTGAIRGYAWYRTKSSWQLTGPDATTQVRAVDALDSATRTALLTTLLDLDLSARAVFWNLPVDDPLLSLLLDPRRALPTFIDQLWVRLVDLPRALRSRSYGAEADVVLEVADAFCPWNAGRWRLAIAGGAASCERTGDTPDVVLDVRELAAAYLGRASLAAAGRAGLAEERTPGALARLSRAFTHDPEPWIPFVF